MRRCERCGQQASGIYRWTFTGSVGDPDPIEFFAQLCLSCRQNWREWMPPLARDIPGRDADAS